MADELLPVYLLTGTDRPKIGRALRRLRTRFGDEAVEVLSAETTSGEDTAAALNSLGLFGAGRLIVVQGVEKWKKADVFWNRLRIGVRTAVGNNGGRWKRHWR